MTGAPSTDLLRLVRRTRQRLEALRIAKACARGALVGGGAGLVLLLVGRLLGWSWAVPWIVMTASTLAAAAGAMLFGRRIREEDAALFLDDRLGTKGGLVTLLEMPAHPFAARFAAGAPARARPALPFPREITMVPVVLFLLFGAGLIPTRAAANTQTPAVSAPGAVVASTASEAAPLPDLEPALAGLRDATPLSEEAVDAARAHIDRRLHRPEDRLAARRELEGARSGDAAAARKLAKRLGEGGTSDGVEGGDGPQQPSGAGTATETEKRGGAASPYPEAVELVRAYHRALVTRGQ